MSHTPRPSHPSREGLFLAFGAFFIWGMGPVFFKFLQDVPTYEIIAYRIIWSLVLLSFSVIMTKSWSRVVTLAKQPKIIFLLFIASLIICANWTIYVWAINHGNILETSLGYYISPLMSIALALVFLKERFRLRQWIALVLAALGIFVQLWTYGTIPIIALGLATSFSLYGFLHKKIGVDAQSSLFFETLCLVIPAVLYLLYFTPGSTTSNIFNNSLKLNLLLIASGAVTTVPLVLFNAAALRLKLSTIGIFQYMGPTMAFLFAIFIYHEPMGFDKWLTFAFIWSGIALFVWDNFNYEHRKSQALKAL